MPASLRIRDERGSGFTLIELLVVVAIIAILMSLLVGGIASVRNRAELSQCSSNLRQIHFGLVQYADDHNERLPRARLQTWDPWPADGLGEPPWLQDVLIPYLGGDIGKMSSMFRCPGTREFWLLIDPESGTYRYNILNASGTRLSHVVEPHMAIVLFDFAYADWTIQQLPHSKTINAIFVDGHVGPLNVDEFLAPSNGGDNSYTTPMMVRGWR